MSKATRVPGLDARSPLRQAAKLLLEARLLDVRRHEEDVPAPEAVHDMRVAARRLRAALRLFKLRPLDAPVKRLQDALGAVRDVQLQIEWLAGRDPALAARRRKLLGRSERALEQAVETWRR